ncbi:hypothetical protein DYBT9275_05475 [Dyadobacter sp. CECT 9275]|uniref:Uncharacterized protein n=1 Tax=Dyadobacter helix TaxID=2822344 RepID=A0A916JHI7_9BACT|nr:hypothetical protein DYBT9275_05475 [Dyadobacter sp. CECT 9275]
MLTDAAKVDSRDQTNRSLKLRNASPRFFGMMDLVFLDEDVIPKQLRLVTQEVGIAKHFTVR